MTTIATIVKATSTTLTVSVEGGNTITIGNPTKGVSGQLAKLGDLIGCLGDSHVVINAEKLPGVFKAFREDSTDLNEFLERFGTYTMLSDTVIVLNLGHKEVIISKGEYDMSNVVENGVSKDINPEVVVEENTMIEQDTTVVEEYELDTHAVEYLELAIEYFDEMSNGDIEELIEEYSVVEEEEIQTLLIKLESLLEERYASDDTKVLEETEEAPEMICDLLMNSWLMTRSSWDTSSLRAKLLTTWKARPEITSKRQGEILKEFFKRAPSGVVSSVDLVKILGDVYSA